MTHPLRILLLSIFILPALHARPAAAQTSDAGAYLEAIQTAKGLAIEDQIDLWRRFLSEHPQSAFREEIENNMKQMDDLLAQTDPNRKKARTDADRYFKAVEFSKKLSPEDQIALWEQFIDENPKSIYRKEAATKLEELRVKSGKLRPAAPKPAERKPEATLLIAPKLAYKDTQKGVLLATFPGLLVPGIGHWYAGDYTTAGILTGFRVAGIAVGLPGILKKNQAMILTGAIIAGITYLVDVVATPSAVDRYNDALDARAKKAHAFFIDRSSLAFRF